MKSAIAITMLGVFIFFAYRQGPFGWLSFCADLGTHAISVENATAMDNYPTDIQTARDRFPTAGSVFDYL